MTSDIQFPSFLSGLNSGLQQSKVNRQNDRQIAQGDRRLDMAEEQMQQETEILNVERLNKQLDFNMQGAAQMVQRARTPEQKQQAIDFSMKTIRPIAEALRVQGVPAASLDLFERRLQAMPTASESAQAELQSDLTKTALTGRLKNQLALEKEQQMIDIGLQDDPDTDLALSIRANGEIVSPEIFGATLAGKVNSLSPQVAASQGKKPQTVVNVDTADNSFLKEGGKLQARQLNESLNGANLAVESLKSNAVARNLVQDGLITGQFANFKVGLGKTLQAAGINIAEDAIANTEAYMAQRAEETGRIIQQFGAGTGLSDADREFALNAAAGNIEFTEDSIKRILDIQDKAARNAINFHNEEVVSNIPEEQRKALPLFARKVDIPDLLNSKVDVAFPKTREEVESLEPGTKFYNPATDEILTKK